MSSNEHVWDMIGRQLVRHGPPAIYLGALWTHIQITWRKIPQKHIKALFGSIPLCLEVVHGGFKPFWNLTVRSQVQFCTSNHFFLIVMYLYCGINFISVTSVLLSVVIFSLLIGKCERIEWQYFFNKIILILKQEWLHCSALCCRWVTDGNNVTSTGRRGRYRSERQRRMDTTHERRLVFIK